MKALWCSIAAVLEVIVILQVLLFSNSCSPKPPSVFTLERVHAVRCSEFHYVTASRNMLSGVDFISSTGLLFSVSFDPETQSPGCETWNHSTWWNVQLAGEDQVYIFKGAQEVK